MELELPDSKFMLICIGMFLVFFLGVVLIDKLLTTPAELCYDQRSREVSAHLPVEQLTTCSP